jgi:cysteinyl-tRNA synthetase
VQVAEAIAARAAARAGKDFAAADAVRLSLASKGIMLMDAASGTTWRPGMPEAAEAAEAAGGSSS